MSASVGAGLGVLVALLWGSADIFVTLATRHIGIFKTTIISQVAGILILLFLGYCILQFWHYHLTISLLETSMLSGILTGLCAALGYYAFYNALEIGPVALVSPIAASSSSLTFLLSIFIHGEQVSVWRMSCIFIVIVGVVLASTSIKQLRQFLHPMQSLPSQRGIYLAIIAMIAFGFMDFGIGVSALTSGWFLPALWTRLFSLGFIVLIICMQRSQIVAFLDRRSIAQEKSYEFSRPVSPYSESYQEVADFDNTRALADLPTVIMSSNIYANVYSRPSSLRRTVMVPFAYPLVAATEQHAVSYAESSELSSIHTTANKNISKFGKKLWISSAIFAGIVENVAVLIFSFDTKIATIGFASAIASSYSLVGILFGVIVYHERLERNQLYGIILCLFGIFFLAV